MIFIEGAIQRPPLQPGDHVTVFQDPFSRNRPEGEAVLVECIQEEDEGFSRWRVLFLDDPEYRPVERMLYRPPLYTYGGEFETNCTEPTTPKALV